MLFSEIEGHPLFTKSYHSYGKHGMVIFYPAPENGMEIVLEHDGREYPISEVQHATGGDGSYVLVAGLWISFWYPLDTDINVYSRKLESVL